MAYLGNTGLTRSIELINKKFVTAEDLGLPIINTNRTIEFIKTTNTAGNKHSPSGGAANQFLKYSASGTAVWTDLPTSSISLKVYS